MSFEIGRFDDISLEDYHKMEGWSKSALDKVHKSMAHYFESLTNKETTAALEFGSAFHSKVLTPELFQKEYVIEPVFGDLRTKAAKELRAQFILENPNKKSINFESAAKIDLMAESIFDHPVASQLLTEGDAEHSFFWVDDKTGFKCKARPDYVRRDGIIIDLKTTSDASWFGFQKSIVNYRYHAQGGHFTNGVSKVTGSNYNTFILIAIETEAPYNVACYNLDEDSLNVGRKSIEMDFDKILEYEKTEWGGYPCMIMDMHLPPWAN
jgi:hypothetical protein